MTNRAHDGIRLVVALVGQDEVVRARLRETRRRPRLASATSLERRRRREVDDVDRRVSRAGERERPRVATAST